MTYEYPVSEEVKRLNPTVAGLVVDAHNPQQTLQKKGIVPKTGLQRGESESAFQQRVIKLLHDNGWLVHSERPARTAKGWATPIQGDAGFPDICAVKDCLLLLELKTKGGKLSPYQEKWLFACHGLQNVEAIVLRPADFEAFKATIEEV